MQHAVGRGKRILLSSKLIRISSCANARKWTVGLTPVRPLGVAGARSVAKTFAGGNALLDLGFRLRYSVYVMNSTSKMMPKALVMATIRRSPWKKVEVSAESRQRRSGDFVLAPVLTARSLPANHPLVPQRGLRGPLAKHT